ncbi:MAG: hypothetical protein JNK79_13100 [Chitinophagaceae bacterium]|nr:hypothetical protein [Chitinophagaceae bacterium]
MNLLSLYLPKKNHKTDPAEHTLVAIHEPVHNITEGSEFLDDAIRTEDQPLMYTEEAIAVGCPEDLL